MIDRITCKLERWYITLEYGLLKFGCGVELDVFGTMHVEAFITRNNIGYGLGIYSDSKLKCFILNWLHPKVRVDEISPAKCIGIRSLGEYFGRINSYQAD